MCCCSCTRYFGWTCVTLIILQLLNGRSLLAKGENNCSNEKLNACVPKTKNEMIFATTDDDLNAVCKTLNEGVECMEQFISMCYTAEQKELYEHMKKSSMGVIENLCTNSTFRLEYLGHAKCFIDSSFSNKQCSSSYNHFVKESLSGTDPLNANNENSLIKFCCAYSDFITCIDDQVLSKCEQSTVIYYKNFISTTIGAIFESPCFQKNYTAGSDWCSKASRFNLQLINLMLPFALLSIMSFTR